MIAEGFKLMILGMVIVYVFLIVLMVCVMISARIFKNRATPVPSSPASRLKSDHDTLVAVVSAAIAAFRAKNKK